MHWHQDPFHILLADDDLDDRFLFEDALNKLSVPTRLTTIDDGERLINYLYKNTHQLPDVLFLDLNMPRKNGSECLLEIKMNAALRHLPVIIYSTSLHEAVADELHKNGAHYYMRKASLIELNKGLHHIITSMKGKDFSQPQRDKFVLKLV